VNAVEAKEVPIKLLGPAKMNRLRSYPDAELASRAAKVLAALGGGSNAQKDEIIAKLQPLAEQPGGDAAKGHVLFTSACSVCHQLNGEGKEVGPHLDGIGAHGVAELLVHIVDPNKQVDAEYRVWNLARRNGSILFRGLSPVKNANTVLIRNAGGIETEVRVEDLKSRVDTGMSLMPEGFEGLGAESLRGSYGVPRGTGNRFRILNLNQQFTGEYAPWTVCRGRRFGDTIGFTKTGTVVVKGIPFRVADATSTVSGSNVVVLKGGGAGAAANKMPQRVEVPVGFAVSKLHVLGGVAGWGRAADAPPVPAMKMTLVYADGSKQEEVFKTGEVFVDFNSNAEVPKSERIRELTNRHHVRYFSVPVEKRLVVQKVILESFDNGVAPTTVAISAETGEPVKTEAEAGGSNSGCGACGGTRADRNVGCKWTDIWSEERRHIADAACGGRFVARFRKILSSRRQRNPGRARD